METNNNSRAMDKRPENITFYILWKGNTEEDCDREMNQIGLEHYQRKYTDKGKNFFHLESVFTKLDGYRILEKAIMEERTDVLENARIFNSKGKRFSIEEMFDRINKAAIVR